MEEPKRQTNLTPEEQRLKEHLMRSGDPTMRKSSGKVPDDFWERTKTREGRRALIKELASSGEPGDIKPGRPISEEFWRMYKPKDPEGMALRYLLEDRREGR